MVLIVRVLQMRYRDYRHFRVVISVSGNTSRPRGTDYQNRRLEGSSKTQSKSGTGGPVTSGYEESGTHPGLNILLQTTLKIDASGSCGRGDEGFESESRPLEEGHATRRREGRDPFREHEWALATGVRRPVSSVKDRV